jgi:polyisoprenoid-binding protein YceI
MKRSLLFTGIVALAAPFATAQTSTWAIDPAHSQIEFVVRHLTLSNIHGRFGNLKGNIIMNDADVTKSTVQVTIDVTSLDTGVPQRDGDVKGPGFFDTAKFPTATFTSTSVSKNGDHLTVNGDLTLHGVTKPVQLDVEGPSGPVPGMDKKPHSGFSATTTFNRKDFGVGANAPATMVGDDIKLTIDLDVAKQ